MCMSVLSEGRLAYKTERRLNKYLKLRINGFLGSCDGIADLNARHSHLVGWHQECKIYILIQRLYDYL